MFGLITVRDYVIGVLVILLLATSISLYFTNTKLKNEVRGRREDRITYELAQRTAEANAYKKKVEDEAQYAERKKQADEAYTDLLTKYNAAIVRYKATKSPTVRSDLPLSTSGSTSLEGESKGALISTEDLMICAENTAKAQIAHDWVERLEEDASAKLTK